MLKLPTKTNKPVSVEGNTEKKLTSTIENVRDLWDSTNKIKKDISSVVSYLDDNISLPQTEKHIKQLYADDDTINSRINYFSIHNNLSSLNTSPYYHSDQSILTTDSVVFNGITSTSGVQGTYAKFGNVSGGNYSHFEADGTIVFYGDATVWEDLNFAPVKSGGPAATRPDDVTIGNIFHKEFTSLNNQLCGDVQELPHNAKLNETIYPHLHIFLKGGESAGTTGVTFTIYWELRQTSGVTTGSVALSATSAQLTANPVIFNIYDNTGFSGPTSLGAQVGLTLARTAGNAGDVIVTTYGLHYKMDSTGSRQIATK